MNYVIRLPYIVCSLLVIILSLLTIEQLPSPFNTDSYYYYNAGKNMAEGRGLTDDYLWVYINAPDSIPTESHRYWMPLTSIVMAAPMAILGSGYTQARLIMIPCWLGMVWLGMWLAGRLSQKRRLVWVTGLTLALGGFYLPFWLTTDSFALFGLMGAGALVALGLGIEQHNWRYLALAGALAALGHLARADGVLLLLVGVLVMLLQGRSSLPNQLTRPRQLLVMIASYLLVMLPWFIRSMNAFGAPLPAGGLGTAYLHGYNDLFSYPAEWDLSYFLDWGMGNILDSRLEGVLIAFQTWLAVEGLIVIAPFALIPLWKRRHEPLWGAVGWYALGLHVAMSLVFTYPGSRGGLFHSSAALLPFWVVLGLVGIDSAVGWMANKRGWNADQAQAVFGWSTLLVPLYLGVFLALPLQQKALHSEPEYAFYAQSLPAHARIMVNDPAAWYFHTGHQGVTLPDASLETAWDIAQRYCITHLIIDENVTEAFEPLITGEADPPPFLTLLTRWEGDLDDITDDVQLYEFELQESCS